MKKLHFPKRFVAIPGGKNPMCLGTAARNCEAANKNGQEVISATLIIERELESLINRHCIDFEKKEKIRFFYDNILRTSWFSFGAKKMVALSIINKEKFLKGKKKSLLERNLKKIMSYRNAFVHGDLIEKEDGTYICYFEGTKREDLLSHEYWEEVQKIFDEIIELLKEVSIASGVPHTKVENK